MLTNRCKMSEPLQPYKLLIKLESEGELKTLVDSAIISTSVLMHFNISKRMDELILKRKYSSRYILVCEVCEEFNVSHTVVYRAMQTFGIKR